MIRLLTLTMFLMSGICSANARFERYFGILLVKEGSAFVNTRYDRAGISKYGVTIHTYREWCRGVLFVQRACDKDADQKLTWNDVRLLTPKDVKPIYQRWYWEVAVADSIKNDYVAMSVTDVLVNMGKGSGNHLGYGKWAHVKAIQKMVGAKADGKIGRQTIARINAADSRRLTKQIADYRWAFYQWLARRDPLQKRWLPGWRNRSYYFTKLYDNERKRSSAAIFWQMGADSGLNGLAVWPPQLPDAEPESRRPERFGAGGQGYRDNLSLARRPTGRHRSLYASDGSRRAKLHGQRSRQLAYAHQSRLADHSQIPAKNQESKRPAGQYKQGIRFT